MLNLWLQGVALGFSAGVAPGPLQTYLITQATTYGWRAGVRVALAPLVSDGPIILILALLLGQLSDAMLGAIMLAGAGVLTYLAWGLLGSWRAGNSIDVSKAPISRSFWQGVLVNFTSPGPY